MSEQLLAGALRLRNAGLSILPIEADGSKRPAITQWKPYESRQPTEGEIRRWFGNGADRGIAIIGGKVSGNLEILDHDAPELISEWRDLVEEASPGLLARLPHVETPSGGLHLFYRCEPIEGNKKLAERAVVVPAEDLPRDGEGVPDEKAIRRAGIRKENGIYFKVETMIETRGEGGYVVTAGSPPACHPLGKPYRLIHGDLKAIPTITPHERDVLLTCARSLNEFIKPARQIAPETAAKPGAALKPGEDFNRRGDVRALLEKHGWKRLGKGRKGENWQRPDGNHQSATLFDSGSLYVFSSNAYPLEPGCSYSPFAIYATLEHDGDFKQAAKALAAEGYGDQKTAAPKGEKEETGKRKSGGIKFQIVGDRVIASNAEGKEQIVCSKLEIVAATRDENNENWGRLLRFPDPDEFAHTWSMPSSLLSGDRSGFESVLRDKGLTVFDSKLLRYYLDSTVKERALCVSKTGWHRGAFVLPDECIGAPDGEAIYHQSAEGGNYLMRCAGTLDQWREHVARYAIGNTRLMFGISAAFAATLLDKLGAESGGFHFRGTTSEGKTTVLLAAGSVWGGSSDKGFLRRWRATINGLESVGEAHNDALLCLDELAEVDPRDAGEVAYMLANGQGKIRQNKTITLRRAPEWRTLFLSTGEISLADHIATVGKRVRGGMQVRLADLPADADKGYGLFEELHGLPTPKRLADTVAANARTYYGTPIREFLRGLVREGEAELREAWRSVKADFQEHAPKKSRPEVGRVCDRFALVALAGEMATEAGITGWDEGEATAAAAEMFKVWMVGRGTMDGADEAAMIAQVRAFIEKHGASRFQRLAPPDERPTIVDRAGLVESGESGAVYYFSPEVFRSDVCKGFDPVAVAKTIDRRKFLLSNHGLQFKKWNPDASKVTPFYAVTDAILEGD